MGMVRRSRNSVFYNTRPIYLDNLRMLCYFLSRPVVATSVSNEKRNIHSNLAKLIDGTAREAPIESCSGDELDFAHNLRIALAYFFQRAAQFRSAKQRTTELSKCHRM